MINFPVLGTVTVTDYGLYPGADQDGLSVNLSSDLTVIVGANGLGKSTLLHIIFRALTGPWDIPGAVRDGVLGTSRLDVKRLRAAEIRTFADRVSDSAREGVVTVQLTLGKSKITIRRSLNNLRLVSWTIDGRTQASDEESYKKTISATCGVGSFADWILVLRYITFYMDDRQALFWDRSAQRQLLRSLFLPSDEAAEWVSLERTALEQDSRHRNLRVVVNQEIRKLARLAAPESRAESQIRNDLEQLLSEDEADAKIQEELLANNAALEELRSNSNLERLQTIQKIDELSTSYEHAKLVTLSSQFPTEAESAAFIWNQVLTDGLCIACNKSAPALQQTVNERIERHECAVCGNELEVEHTLDENVVELSEERAAKIWRELVLHRDALKSVVDANDEAQRDLASNRSEIAQVNLKRSKTERRVQELRSNLPSDADAYVNRRNELGSMRARLEEYANELQDSADRLNKFMGEKTAAIFSRANSVQAKFDFYAKLFLLGNGSLAWSPRAEALGQSSHKIQFPAYELELRRNDTGIASRRSSIDDVSESQKEFIDLAFRMALIETSSSAGASIVIDTPESSLDTVFSDRAATVLADFAATKSKIVVASNLTDGRLIPLLVKHASSTGATSEIVNLIEMARPTPAIEELGNAYAQAYDELLAEIEEGK